MDKHPEEYEDCLERFESILMELQDFFDSTPYTPTHPASVVYSIGPVRVCCNNGGSPSDSIDCEDCRFQRKDKCMLLQLQRVSGRVLNVCHKELEPRAPVISEYTGKITISPDGFDIEANLFLPDNGRSFAILQCAVDTLYQERHAGKDAALGRMHVFLSNVTGICVGRSCDNCPLNIQYGSGLCVGRYIISNLVGKLNDHKKEILCNLEQFCSSSDCDTCKLNHPGNESCLFGDVLEYYEMQTPRPINFKVTPDDIHITGASVQSCNILKPAFEEIQKCISR